MRQRHVFGEFQVDSGSVEASNLFQKQRSLINITLGLKAIEVNPININMK